MSKKLKIIFLSTIALILVCLFCAYAVYYFKFLDLEVSKVSLISVNGDNNTFTIEIDGKGQEEFSCLVYNDLNKYDVKAINNKCEITLDINKDYLVSLYNLKTSTKEVYLTDYINNVLAFNFNEEVIYLTLGKEKNFVYNELLIDKDKNKEDIIIKDESVAVIENNIIKGLKVGETEIYAKKLKKTMKVIVTDLISEPYLSEKKKEIIQCNQYSKEESEELDKILAYRINTAGYKTRAAAVAAARFITLEFKYRIPYFYENGRVHESGVHFADGEGRYYKTGLYLHEDKKKDIIASWRGPAIWGCPLTNLEDEPGYGYIMGAKKPNGLDCSGFVSWALLNAGFDPGDIGAGDTDYKYQMTKLGKFTPLTDDLIKSGKIRTGDLINYWGHIGIIIGIDDDNIYVAESLPNLGGLVAKKYQKTKIRNTFTHVVLMDEYYVNDGNLTNMW